MFKDFIEIIWGGIMYGCVCYVILDQIIINFMR